MSKNHYVDNVKLLEEFKKYTAKRKEHAENGLGEPRLPEYIGEAILKIATRFAYRPNFINYSYREEMVSDAIENCIKCAKNFDHEKSSNPFAYFTQVTHYAFIRRIQKEKKQTQIKSRIVYDMPFEVFEMHDSFDGEDEDFKNQYIEFLRENEVYGLPPEVKPKKPRQSSYNDIMDLVSE